MAPNALLQEYCIRLGRSGEARLDGSLAKSRPMSETVGRKRIASSTESEKQKELAYDWIVKLPHNNYRMNEVLFAKDET